MTTTQSLQLFLRALQGQNYSPKTLRAYGDDLAQFLEWVKKNRVDFDVPTRFSRNDIEGFRLFAIIWAESKSLHNRLISFFSGCVHFAIQRPGVESA